jgi:hypothetical protein
VTPKAVASGAGEIRAMHTIKPIVAAIPMGNPNSLSRLTILIPTAKPKTWGASDLAPAFYAGISSGCSRIEAGNVASRLKSNRS